MERARGVQLKGHVDVGRNLQGRARDHNRHTDSKALVITPATTQFESIIRFVQARNPAEAPSLRKA
jgi:hypothetical protein